MTSYNQKTKVALTSVFASGFMALMNLAAGLLTGSLGLLSAAGHAAVDFSATLLTFFAVKAGDKPADKRHPYGHAKIESVSALIETALLFAISGWVIYEAINRLFFKTAEVKILWYSIAVIVISIIIDISRSRALKKVAKETHSQALEADALHFSTDIFSSLAVLIGLLFMQFGINFADSAAALIVALFIIIAGWRLGKRTIDVLIDAAPEGLTERIIETAKRVEGVIGIEKARVRPAGAFVFVDIVINISRKLPLNKTQLICKEVEEKIDKLVLPKADIAVRANPLSLDDETIADRVKIVASNYNINIHHIAVHSVGGKKCVSFDIELDPDLTIGRAHQIASHLEELIKNEIGGEAEIISHIEQFKPDIIEAENVVLREEKNISNAIIGVIGSMEEIKSSHDIKVIKANNKLFVSLHCVFDAKMPVEKVHELASQAEHLIKNRIPDIERIVVHTEAGQ